MEELSIEEKAKAYDRALERVKNIKTGKCKTTFVFTEGLFEHIFPELKESEGEKVNRILHSISSKMGSHLRDIFTEEEFQCFDAWSNAWLEKQGEQKPAWSEEDKKKLNRIYMLLAEAADEHAFSSTCRLIGDKECVELQDFLRSLKPQSKQEWSEEDKVGLDDALWCCKQAASIAKDENDMGNAWYAENWLKSLKKRIGG